MNKATNQQLEAAAADFISDYVGEDEGEHFDEQEVVDFARAYGVSPNRLMTTVNKLLKEEPMKTQTNLEIITEPAMPTGTPGFYAHVQRSEADTRNPDGVLGAPLGRGATREEAIRDLSRRIAHESGIKGIETQCEVINK